jgi:hypothetical protein
MDRISSTLLGAKKPAWRYTGPQHFWHTYALNPREKYYFGYYGMYGPFSGPRTYYEDARVPQSACFGSSGGCNESFQSGESGDFGLLGLIGIGALVVLFCKSLKK